MINRTLNHKPFVKWVGGKSQLVKQYEELLPIDFNDWKDVTYIEPFVGGGAMLFYMLSAHHNITNVVINDINPKLITCYEIIRDFPKQLIEALAEIEKQYKAIPTEQGKKEYYLQKRMMFNDKQDRLTTATLFIFLNRTCFNGLYRENKKGEFNVPFGKYVSPTICDVDTISLDSKLLQRVQIMHGDYQETLKRATGKTLFYLDPPYRPISSTSSFNDYTSQPFDDSEQIRLKEFCDVVNQKGYTFMLSNSDGTAKDPNDNFFDDLYKDYQIKRVLARRSVNANASKRGKLSEILVHNYLHTKMELGIFPVIRE